VRTFAHFLDSSYRIKQLPTFRLAHIYALYELLRAASKRGHRGWGSDRRPGARRPGNPHLMGVGRHSETGAGGNEMRVIQAFRFELDPSREARIALEKHVGAARFAYNWGLARGQRTRQADPFSGGPPQGLEQVEARERPLVGECAPQEAFEQAVRNWRKGRANFPRFKRKADNKARLTGHIRVTPRHVLASARSAPRSGRTNSWSSFSPRRPASSRQPSPERRIAGS